MILVTHTGTYWFVHTGFIVLIKYNNCVILVFLRNTSFLNFKSLIGPYKIRDIFSYI